MPSRRHALALAAGLFGLAGCVGDEPATEPSPSASSTPTRTETEAARTTNTCAEQFVSPDIEIYNERSTEARVSVALVELPEGSVDAPIGRASATSTSTATVTGTPAATPTPTATPRPDGEAVFERTYTLEAGGSLEEDRRIFRDTNTDAHDYRFDCTHDGATASLAADAAARNPQMYGIHVEVGADGPEAWERHADPGESYNPNCY